MRFTRLELLNWDIQSNQVVVLQPGVNLLTGENGSGKTSILDAIKVVLGGTRIGGDRSVEDYLATVAAPFAMIRLVADNEPAEDSRKRPFDVVQPSEEDLFTLAVIYEATEDGYTPRWYFCPGDVSPLQRGFEGRSFTTKGDYTARLQKLGMGPSFRKLLCTPQGQVAALCSHDSRELFDLLFDFIGGKKVLDDWEILRKDFERQQRSRDDRGQILERREAELGGLRNLLRAHERYRSHLERHDLATQAVPIARSREARATLSQIEQHIEQLDERARVAVDEGREAREALQTIAKLSQEAAERDEELKRRGVDLDQRWRALEGERAKHQAKLDHLEQLRREVSEVEPRDLEALIEQRTICEDQQADLRAEGSALDQRTEELRAEKARLEKGLLTPPEGVDDFRAALRTHEVPHHLLMDLIEPLSPDERTRRALESYLGDFRFAVAVPDIESFVRATALAREHRFPFYVLAPDVRSPAPTSGEHPFLDQVRVGDPKYRGLVTRVLRGVRWLEGKVETTQRERGVIRVDAEGFVLDRKGGRHQGTDRFYLGRDALERRRLQLEADLRECEERRQTVTVALGELTQKRNELNAAIVLEERRRRWIARAQEHAHLAELVASLSQQLQELELERQQHRDALESQKRRQLDLGASRAREEERAKSADARASKHSTEVDKQRGERERAQRRLAETVEQDPEEPSEAARSFAIEHPLAVLENILASEERNLKGFREAERDPNLPANVTTLDRQVEAVRGELERLDADVDRAREAAERAHDQYKTATRRIFRRYFASLTQAGEPLGFTIDGSLRPREDGRFTVDVTAAAGEKALVPYSSPSLSGGQKAALSMLMAMTTLRVHHADGGPGFFLIDEPFSASDTHKIQELGAFLARTGAQYIVSMPTTEELRRCGSWLQAVLTCTLTPGGRDASGRLRIAPPVKCSYVVHRAD